MTMKQSKTRGGKRDGAGRKSLFALGREERIQLIKDVDAEFKRNGTTRGTELGKLMNSSDKRLKMQAYQLFYRDCVPRTSENEVSGRQILKPQIFLPEQYPDDDSAPDYEPTAPEPVRLANIKG